MNESLVVCDDKNLTLHQLEKDQPIIQWRKIVFSDNYSNLVFLHMSTTKIANLDYKTKLEETSPTVEINAWLIHFSRTTGDSRRFAGFRYI